MRNKQTLDYMPDSSQSANLPSTPLLPKASSTTLLATSLPTLETPAIYFTLDLAGIVLAVNPYGAASLGYSSEALIGRSIVHLFHPQDQIRLKTELLTWHSAHSVQRGELRLICQDGRVLQQSITVQALQTMTEPGLLLVCNHVQPQLSSTVNSLEAIQAEQLLRQQTEWDRLMQAMVQPVRQSLGLRFILRTIAAELRDILQIDRVLFYQARSGKTGSILAEALAVDCSTVFKYTRGATAIFQQKCFQFQSLNETDSVYLTEQHSTFPQLNSSAQQFGAQSEAIVPIMQQDKLWGLLVVHQYKHSRPWQPWELGLLKQLAAYLDSIIQQVELYQKVQRLNADLERQIQARTAELQLAFDFEATLKRITDKVRDSLDEHQILETVVQELVCAIGISCCNASIYDLEAGTSTICYEYTTSISPYQGRVVQLDAFPEIYNQLLEGQAFQFCSLVINPTRGKVSMLTCPIVDDQGILGDLWLVNQPYYCFTEQDIRLVQQVANQCAIAIRQARLYQAAQAQVEELERLNRLKDDFLSTVSHELRTPMANVKMATQMLGMILNQAGLLEGHYSKAAKYFQILQAECQREINLINDLLDLSRLDTEQTPLELVHIDLKTWLPTIVQPFLERAHSHQQQLEMSLPVHLPRLTTDLSSLERILTELLQNACKYTPSGGTITVAAWLANQEREPALKNQEPEAGDRSLVSSPLSSVHSPSFIISVTNMGVEIPPQELSRVFEKFYRIPNNDPWQHGGTGLGLALVKKLAECLNGTIWAESKSGQTRFTLELPISLPDVLS